jgi:hypothetical protein
MAMIGDVALKIRQPLKEDGGEHSLVGEGAWGTNENIINILIYFSFATSVMEKNLQNSNNATNFSSDIGKQLLFANNKNRVR